MKKMMMITSLLFLASTASAKGVKENLSLVQVPVEHAYLPAGFDSNDNVEVVVEGYLPNLCYKSPRTNIEYKGSEIHIELLALKNETPGYACAEMVVPFVQVAGLGVLDKGDYQIFVNGKNMNKMHVQESTSSAIDDYIYANVEYVETKSGVNHVSIKGHNPSDCFVFDRFEVFDNGRDVYSVLPIMEQVSDFCPMKMVPFSFEFEVPSNLKNNKVLLHVRAMNGDSVNAIFHKARRK